MLMESELSRPRLHSFVRNLVHAARKQQARSNRMQDLAVHIENIKRYARNPRIRKETLQQEIFHLKHKVAEVVQRQDPFAVTPQMEEQFRSRVLELEDHLAHIDQRLLLDEQRRNAQIELLVSRLDGITGQMGALCKRLHVAPPKTVHAMKSRKESARRDAHGRFVKRKLPPTQSVFAPAQKSAPKSQALLIHSWTQKRHGELTAVRRQLQGLQLQYYNLKRRVKHGSPALQEIAAYIEKLKGRMRVLEE